MKCFGVKGVKHLMREKKKDYDIEKIIQDLPTFEEQKQIWGE